MVLNEDQSVHCKSLTVDNDIVFNQATEPQSMTALVDTLSDLLGLDLEMTLSAYYSKVEVDDLLEAIQLTPGATSYTMKGIVC